MQNTKENLQKTERLVLLRKTMKLKQIDIAKELDIQQLNYCKIEKGLDYVPDKALKLLEDLFSNYKAKRLNEIREEIKQLEILDTKNEGFQFWLTKYFDIDIKISSFQSKGNKGYFTRGELWKKFNKAFNPDSIL